MQVFACFLDRKFENATLSCLRLLFTYTEKSIRNFRLYVITYILWIFIQIANAWLPNNPFFLLHCLCSRKVKGNLFLDLNYHGDQIQSMCWRGNSTLIATTCKDKKLRLLDPRLSSVAQVCFIKCVCSAVALMVEWLRFQTLRQYFIKMVGSVLA